MANQKPISRDEVLRWLREENPDKLQELWKRADAVRAETVGDEVHLRGLIEISNHCVRKCAYCGLNALRQELDRYRMPREEIINCALEAVQMGYGTVVMQAGEDYAISEEALSSIIREIKEKTPLAITLSMGERSMDELKAWREAGADRYLIRFETSDRALYDRIHPPIKGEHSDRFAILSQLRTLGYEIGSGVMIGIPGQTYETLADDLMKYSEMDLDMIGMGPFLLHPDTPLGEWGEEASNDPDQVPNTEHVTYRCVALARLLCPEANIPSTTALATLNKAQGRELGLQRGANVIMPNLTPMKYRAMYEIYPAKVCIDETARDCSNCVRGRIASVGRKVGKGPGFRNRR